MEGSDTHMTNRRLRIAHVLIQPVLVYDDGKELTPGPEMNVAELPVSQVTEFLSKLLDEVADYREPGLKGK